MSLVKTLDEYTEKELQQELLRRVELRAAGKCDYCERYSGTTDCRFPDRHHDLRSVPMQVQRFEASRR